MTALKMLMHSSVKRRLLRRRNQKVQRGIDRIRPVSVLALMIAIVGATFLGSLVPFARASGSVIWAADGVVVAPASLTNTVDGIQTLGAFKNKNATSKPLAQLSGGDYVFAWYESAVDGIVAQRVNSAGATQWGSSGASVYAAGGNSVYVEGIVADSSNGVIIVYQINGSQSIYAQKLDGTGATQWTAGGLPVADLTDADATPVAISDGQDGIIVAYRSGSPGSTDIYAQRLDASGAKQWLAGGTVISAATNNQSNPVIVTSGTSSAIVGWTDLRSGTNNDIYAQKISSAGTVQWTADGVAISTDPGNQSNMVSATADGSDGAVFTWGDDRLGAQGVYVQRVDASGVVQWTADGVGLFSGIFSPQFAPRVTMSSTNAMIVYTRMDTDGDLYIQKLDASGALMFGDGLKLSNGAASDLASNIVQAGDGSTDVLVTWMTDDVPSNVKAQRINTNGDVMWTADGVAIVTDNTVNDTNPTTSPYGITNAAGDLVIVGDRTSFSLGDVFAQRIRSSDGAPQWNGTSSLLLPNGPSNIPAVQYNRIITADGSGNYITAWEDYRTDGTTSEVYAQKFDATGTALWTATGVPVATGTPSTPSNIVADGAGGAFITWVDGTSMVAKVQRIDSTGAVAGGWPVGGLTISAVSVTLGVDVFGSVADGAGGIIAMSYVDGVISGVRVTSAAATPWGATGVEISDPLPLGTPAHSSGAMISDGAGGAYFSWVHNDSSAPNPELRMVRLDSSGAVVSGWTTYGKLVTSEDTASYDTLALVPGGVVVAWEQTTGNYDIKAQMFDGSGNALWTAGGVDVVAVAGDQRVPRVVASDTGSIIAWSDERDVKRDIYAQRLNASGVPQWAAGGVPVRVATGDQLNDVQVVSDGGAGMVLTWTDQRDDGFNDVYAQRIDSTGTPRWTVDGIAVAAQPGITEEYPSIVSNGDAGAVIAFEGGSTIQTRAQMISDSSGAPSVTVTAPNGGESLTGNGTTNVTWTSGGVIDHFKISLSTDSGATFPTVVTASTASSPYLWTVNNITTTTARVKIEAQDVNNVTIAQDVSNADLSITAASGGGGGSNPSPAMTVGLPNGGETMTPGSSFNIFWNSQGTQVTSIRLALSSDGGATYPTAIASGLSPAAGFYAWDVPADLPGSTLARVKAEALNGSTVLAMDVSDANFTIVGSPSVPPPVTSATSTPSVVEPPPTEPPAAPTGPVVLVDVRIGVNATTLDFPPATTEPKPGDTVTYLITLFNKSQAIAPNVVIADRLPPGTAYDGPSLTLGDTLYSDANDGDAAAFDVADRIATFRLGTIAAEGIVRASLRVIVLPGATMLDNTATVTGDGISTRTDQTKTPVASAGSPVLSPAQPASKTILPVEKPQAPTPPPSPAGEPVPQPPMTGGGGTPSRPGEEIPPGTSGNQGGTSGGSGVPLPIENVLPAASGAPSFTEELATAAASVGDFLMRTDATLSETPVLDTVLNVVKDMPVLAPAVESVRAATKAVRESPAVQATNGYAITPATFVIVAGVTASGVGGIAGMFPYFLFLLTQPIALLRRRKLKSYGTAYNFATKLPVDLAIVRLSDAATGRAAGSRVTDRQGRYLMIAPPGRFKLDARKQGFAFPPALPAAPEADGRYADLSFGQEFALPQGGVIAKNVPLDPFEDRRPDRIVLRDAVRSRAQWAIVAVGPGAAVLSYAATPKLIQLLAVAAQIGLYLLFRRLARPRRPKNWGIVRGPDGKPLRQAIVRIHETQYDKVLESQVTDAQGRYAFLVGPGRFYLTIEKQGHAPIKTAILDFTAKPDASVAAVDVAMRSIAPAVSSPA